MAFYKRLATLLFAIFLVMAICAFFAAEIITGFVSKIWKAIISLIWRNKPESTDEKKENDENEESETDSIIPGTESRSAHSLLGMESTTSSSSDSGPVPVPTTIRLVRRSSRLQQLRKRATRKLSKIISKRENRQ